MGIFHQSRENQVLMNAVIVLFAAQLAKFPLEFWSTGTVKFERLLGNGGMPSSHSVTVSTLVLGAGYCYGAASFKFAVSSILAMIVITDTIGARQEAGKQSKPLNEMMETDFWKQEDPGLLPVKLKEPVGHTPLQVAVGVVVGILVALVVGYGLYH